MNTLLTPSSGHALAAPLALLVSRSVAGGQPTSPPAGPPGSGDDMIISFEEPVIGFDFGGQGGFIMFTICASGLVLFW